MGVKAVAAEEYVVKKKMEERLGLSHGNMHSMPQNKLHVSKEKLFVRTPASYNL